MEILFELLARFLLELFLQCIFELGGRGILSAFTKDSSSANPWLSICGYISMGAVAGGICIWIIPMHLFASPAIQLLSLAITPIALGFIFEFLGRWRTNHGRPQHAVDRFSYGFTFALSMGLVRYFFAA